MAQNAAQLDRHQKGGRANAKREAAKKRRHMARKAVMNAVKHNQDDVYVMEGYNGYSN